MRVQSTGFGVRLQSSEFRVQSSEFRVQSSEFRVQSSEFRVQETVQVGGRKKGYRLQSERHCFPTGTRFVGNTFSTDMLSLTGRSLRAEVEKGERFRCSVFGCRVQNTGLTTGA